MLKFKNIELKVAGNLLFSLPDLTVDKGLIALVGRNGSGKSSFIRAIMNDFPGVTGEIYLNEDLIKEFSNTEIATRIAVVFSRVDVFGDHTVFDILRLGRLPYQNRLAKSTGDDELIIEKTLLDLGIAAFKSRRFSSLSDGEKQLVMIARAFVQDTEVILMDEPTAFLDVVNRNKLVNQLSELAERKGKLILFSTHDIELLDDSCSSVLLIDNNELVQLNRDVSFNKQIKTAFNLSL